MRRDKFIPGLILVLIGAVVLLRNFGYLHFHWSNIIHLWPIFLVIGGVNLIFANNRTVWASVIKITVVIVGLGLLLFGDFGKRYSFPYVIFNHHNNHNDNDDDNSMDFDDNDDDSDSTTHSGGIVKVDGNSFYHTTFAPGTKIARLNLSGGGTTYNLSDTTTDLFAANVKEYYGRYNLKNHIDDSVSVVDFNMNSHQHRTHFNWDDNKSNTVTLKLNSNPEWDVNIKAGATSLDFDLAKFKVRSLVLSGGAASFNIKFGQPVANNTKVTISSGVSDITVSVPKDAACMITSSTGLSSNNFDGFNNDGDNQYKTPGFDSAQKRIYITISGGLSDFKVRRY